MFEHVQSNSLDWGTPESPLEIFKSLGLEAEEATWVLALQGGDSLRKSLAPARLLSVATPAEFAQALELQKSWNGVAARDGRAMRELNRTLRHAGDELIKAAIDNRREKQLKQRRNAKAQELGQQRAQQGLLESAQAVGRLGGNGAKINPANNLAAQFPATMGTASFPADAFPVTGFQNPTATPMPQTPAGLKAARNTPNGKGNGTDGKTGPFAPTREQNSLGINPPQGNNTLAGVRVPVQGPNGAYFSTRYKGVMDKTLQYQPSASYNEYADQTSRQVQQAALNNLAADDPKKFVDAAAHDAHRALHFQPDFQSLSRFLTHRYGNDAVKYVRDVARAMKGHASAAVKAAKDLAGDYISDKGVTDPQELLLAAKANGRYQRALKSEESYRDAWKQHQDAMHDWAERDPRVAYVQAKTNQAAQRLKQDVSEGRLTKDEAREALRNINTVADKHLSKIDGYENVLPTAQRFAQARERHAANVAEYNEHLGHYHGYRQYRDTRDRLREQAGSLESRLGELQEKHSAARIDHDAARQKANGLLRQLREENPDFAVAESKLRLLNQKPPAEDDPEAVARWNKRKEIVRQELNEAAARHPLGAAATSALSQANRLATTMNAHGEELQKVQQQLARTRGVLGRHLKREVQPLAPDGRALHHVLGQRPADAAGYHANTLNQELDHSLRGDDVHQQEIAEPEAQAEMPQAERPVAIQEPKKSPVEAEPIAPESGAIPGNAPQNGAIKPQKDPETPINGANPGIVPQPVAQTPAAQAEPIPDRHPHVEPDEDGQYRTEFDSEYKPVIRNDRGEPVSSTGALWAHGMENHDKSIARGIRDELLRENGLYDASRSGDFRSNRGDMTALRSDLTPAMNQAGKIARRYLTRGHYLAGQGIRDVPLNQPFEDQPNLSPEQNERLRRLHDESRDEIMALNDRVRQVADQHREKLSDLSQRLDKPDDTDLQDEAGTGDGPLSPVEYNRWLALATKGEHEPNEQSEFRDLNRRMTEHGLEHDPVEEPTPHVPKADSLPVSPEIERKYSLNPLSPGEEGQYNWYRNKDSGLTEGQSNHLEQLHFRKQLHEAPGQVAELKWLQKGLPQIELALKRAAAAQGVDNPSGMHAVQEIKHRIIEAQQAAKEMQDALADFKQVRGRATYEHLKDRTENFDWAHFRIGELLHQLGADTAELSARHDNPNHDPGSYAELLQALRSAGVHIRQPQHGDPLDNEELNDDLEGQVHPSTHVVGSALPEVNWGKRPGYRALVTHAVPHPTNNGDTVKSIGWGRKPESKTIQLKYPEGAYNVSDGAEHYPTRGFVVKGHPEAFIGIPHTHTEWAMDHPDLIRRSGMDPANFYDSNHMDRFIHQNGLIRLMDDGAGPHYILPDASPLTVKTAMEHFNRDSGHHAPRPYVSLIDHGYVGQIDEPDRPWLPQMRRAAREEMGGLPQMPDAPRAKASFLSGEEVEKSLPKGTWSSEKLSGDGGQGWHCPWCGEVNCSDSPETNRACYKCKKKVDVVDEGDSPSGKENWHVLPVKGVRKSAPGEDCPHCGATLERGDDGKCNQCGEHWPEEVKKSASESTYLINWHGLQVHIENPKGSWRIDEKNDPPRWKTKMQAHYGEILASESSADGDPIDVFVGDYPEAQYVYIVKQVRPDTGAFDEQKCMLNFKTMAAAKAMYLKHYDTPKFFGGIKRMKVEEFLRKVKATAQEPGVIKGLSAKDQLDRPVQEHLDRASHWKDLLDAHTALSSLPQSSDPDEIHQKWHEQWKPLMNHRYWRYEGALDPEKSWKNRTKEAGAGLRDEIGIGRMFHMGEWNNRPTPQESNKLWTSDYGWHRDHSTALEQLARHYLDKLSPAQDRKPVYGHVNSIHVLNSMRYGHFIPPHHMAALVKKLTPEIVEREYGGGHMSMHDLMEGLKALTDPVAPEHRHRHYQFVNAEEVQKSVGTSKTPGLNESLAKPWKQVLEVAEAIQTNPHYSGFTKNVPDQTHLDWVNRWSPLLQKNRLEFMHTLSDKVPPVDRTYNALTPLERQIKPGLRSASSQTPEWNSPKEFYAANPTSDAGWEPRHTQALLLLAQKMINGMAPKSGWPTAQRSNSFRVLNGIMSHGKIPPHHMAHLVKKLAPDIFDREYEGGHMSAHDVLEGLKSFADPVAPEHQHKHYRFVEPEDHAG